MGDLCDISGQGDTYYRGQGPDTEKHVECCPMYVGIGHAENSEKIAVLRQDAFIPVATATRLSSTRSPSSLDARSFTLLLIHSRSLCSMSAEYEDVLTNQPVVIDNVRARLYILHLNCNP